MLAAHVGIMLHNNLSLSYLFLFNFFPTSETRQKYFTTKKRAFYDADLMTHQKYMSLNVINYDVFLKCVIETSL